MGPQVNAIRAWLEGREHADHDTFSMGREFAEALLGAFDAATAVAVTSYRDAMTEPIYDDGKAGPSLADLAHVEVTTEMRNFQVQAAIGDEMRRWLVPPQHRPTCPSGRPCTSWTCLVDVCVLTKDNADG